MPWLNLGPAPRAKKSPPVEERDGWRDHLLTLVTRFKKLFWINRRRFQNHAAHPRKRFQILLNPITHIIEDEGFGAIRGKSPTAWIGGKIFAFRVAKANLHIVKIGRQKKSSPGAHFRSSHRVFSSLLANSVFCQGNTHWESVLRFWIGDILLLNPNNYGGLSGRLPMAQPFRFLDRPQ